MRVVVIVVSSVVLAACAAVAAGCGDDGSSGSGSGTTTEEETRASFTDAFDRPDGPLGSAPDGLEWMGTGGALPTIRDGNMVAARAPGAAAYAAVTLDDVPDHMAMTFTVTGARGRGAIALGLLNNRPTPTGFLENLVHITITDRGWAIGLVDGTIDLTGRGGAALTNLSVGRFRTLAPGTYTASVTRRGDTVEVVDPRARSHSATDPRFAAFWGERCDWEIVNTTAGGREARIFEVSAGPGDPPPPRQ